MAATSKPIRKLYKKLATEKREKRKKEMPHKGTMKAKIRSEVKYAKTQPGGKKLPRLVKKFGKEILSK